LHSGWNLATVDVLNKTSGIKGTYNYFDWIPMGGGSISLKESLSVQVGRTSLQVPLRCVPQFSVTRESYTHITSLSIIL